MLNAKLSSMNHLLVPEVSPIINFYKSVFGGEFSSVSRFSEMPPQEGMTLPDEYGNKIMHISLPISEETIIMGAAK